MCPVEFEEKDFEHPLYNQLLNGSPLLATPGQVFEGFFGVDAFLKACHPEFWRMFGQFGIPDGVDLNDFRWGFVWRRLGRSRRLPTFAVNLMIQSKRPDKMNGKNPRLSPFGLSGNYWRFETEEHQQNLLNAVTRVLRRRALVLYASPAFDTFDELYSFTENRRIVENCSFVRVDKMSGHHSWNYNSPGTRGVAASEPIPVEDPPLPQQIEALSEGAPQRDSLESLQFLYRGVVEACEESLDHGTFATTFLRHRERLEIQARDLSPQNPEVLPFVAVQQFCHVLRLQWCVVEQKEKSK